MHYSELHGDMPINALQAFGGYMAMGGFLGQEIANQVKAKTITPQEGLAKFLATFNPAKFTGDPRTETSPSTFEDGLLEIVYSANQAGAVDNTTHQAFAKFQNDNKGQLNVQVAEAQRILAGGMSTTHKILIGAGILGLIAGGYYLYSKND